MIKQKLLIFAHYYAPDTASTGQLLQDLAEGLLDTFDVTVICVVPSYDGKISAAYQTQPFYFEELNGVKLIRVRVPAFDKTDKKSRIKNILSYALGATKACGKSGAQDVVLTISQPPILGGLLGVVGKIRKKAKLIYCIQDFNPEQIMAVNYSKNGLILKAAMWADKFSCQKADLVITVGCDLVDTLVNRFAGKKVPNYVLINNWIDEREVYPLPADHERVQAFKQQYGLENKFVIMYSGNLGLYYDLENLMKVIEDFAGVKTPGGRSVAFAFVGAGSEKEKLVHYAAEHHMDQVVFIPYQDKADLIYSLNAGDVHWCVNAKGIKGVSCPSKAYGIMGAGKPMIGVLETGTEIRKILEGCDCGKCCEPGDYDGVRRILNWYIENADTDLPAHMGQSGRDYLEKYLTKEVSISKYREAIVALGRRAADRRPQRF